MVPSPLPVQTKVDAAGEAAHSDEHADKEDNEEEVEGCHDGEILTDSTEGSNCSLLTERFSLYLTHHC